jgi:Bacterial membrane protein YfhO
MGSGQLVPWDTACIRGGILSEYNSTFNISQLNAYSATIPASYFYNAWETGTLPRSWRYALSIDLPWYCPQITTIQAARLYGVGFVLTPAYTFGPPGSSFVSNIGDEILYRISSSGEATLVATKNQSLIPNVDTQGEVLKVTHPNESSMTVSTSSLNPGYLRIRLTNTPGWRATIDGKPLTLIPFDRMMLQAFIPSGTHYVTLEYWPRTFEIGLWIAGLTALGLLLLSIYLVLKGKSFWHFGISKMTDPRSSLN